MYLLDCHVMQNQDITHDVIKTISGLYTKPSYLLIPNIRFMNIALLTAGGVGNRMGQDIPKQFMTIDNCPVIIYTVQAFQRSEDIDAIAIVCLEGWEAMLQSYANQYNITKLRWIFPAGATNQESIHCGILGLKEAGCHDEDIVLIHDGVRPLVSERIIRENIYTAKKHGAAVTGLKCKEVIMELEEDCVKYIETPREKLIRTQTPHTYRLGVISKTHHKAETAGLDMAASCNLVAYLETNPQYWVMGSEKNGLKLTNVEDIALFKSLIHIDEEPWIK